MGKLYTATMYFIYISSVVTFAALIAIKAPYGRYSRSGWGPTIHARTAWIVMESPAVLVILLLYITSESKPATATCFIAFWQIHYLYRTCIYPFLMRGGYKEFPAVLIVMAIVFNTANGYVNGWFLFHSRLLTDSSWLADPRFIVGAVMFFTGMYIHVRSDYILRHLRKPEETAYKVPVGGAFKYLSAPNYTGEIIQWCGWALLTWSWAGLSFAVFTFANLVPRGLAHHKWYRETFPDYPKNRKAVVPFLL